MSVPSDVYFEKSWDDHDWVSADKVGSIWEYIVIAVYVISETDITCNKQQKLHFNWNMITLTGFSL